VPLAELDRDLRAGEIKDAEEYVADARRLQRESSLFPSWTSLKALQAVCRLRILGRVEGKLRKPDLLYARKPLRHLAHALGGAAPRSLPPRRR